MLLPWQSAVFDLTAFTLTSVRCADLPPPFLAQICDSSICQHDPTLGLREGPPTCTLTSKGGQTSCTVDECCGGEIRGAMTPACIETGGLTYPIQYFELFVVGKRYTKYSIRLGVPTMSRHLPAPSTSHLMLRKQPPEGRVTCFDHSVELPTSSRGVSLFSS